MPTNASNLAQHSRDERLYVCPEYRLFFLTGQELSSQDGAEKRNAGILCTPFNALNAKHRAELDAIAAPFEDSDVHVSINLANQSLAFYDRHTRVTSFLPFSKLDKPVRKQIEGSWKQHILALA